MISRARAMRVLQSRQQITAFRPRRIFSFRGRIIRYKRARTSDALTSNIFAGIFCWQYFC
jgi:hypothetical protein